MTDHFIAFCELCSVVILAPKWSNTKFVFLHRPWAILEFTSIMWRITLVRTEVSVLTAQVPFVNALILGNSADIAIRHYISKN